MLPIAVASQYWLDFGHFAAKESAMKLANPKDFGLQAHRMHDIT